MRIQSQVSIRGTHGKMAVQTNAIRTQSGPCLFPVANRQGADGCSSFVMGYLDDIIIFSKTEEEHLQHLEEIFVRLRKFGLKMKREKCSFFKKHIQYLGHLVLEKGF